MLAAVYQKQQKPAEQISVLTEHVTRCGDDLTAAMELLSLHVAAEDWQPALAAAKLVMAIDPLQTTAVRHTLTAASAVHDDRLAVLMLTALLELEPADAARTHYQLAQVLQNTDKAAARRHVLLSLEQAPRYRDAHTLLLALSRPAAESKP